jgi:hypothetical protein
MNLEALARELRRRGHRVTAIERTGFGCIVGFELIGPGKPPHWFKAFQVARADPDLVEHELSGWKGAVIRDLIQGVPSQVVRRMVAEHGQDRVLEAMS